MFVVTIPCQETGFGRTVTQLPPTLRGERERGTKPREEVALHGCSVWCFGTRARFDVAFSDD